VAIPSRSIRLPDAPKGFAAVSSPYSSNLLQQSSHDADTRQSSYQQPPQHVRSVTHVVAQPQQPAYAPVPYAPQPVYAAPRQRGGAVSSVASVLVLGLIVILVGVIALVGGYYAMRSFAPTAAEAAAETNIANQSGYQAGRDNGLAQGRHDGAAAAGSSAQLKAALAKQKAYDAAYQRGMSAGLKSYRRPRSYAPYRSSYRGPSLSYARPSAVTQALGSAQAIANATGAPVDVQVFG
jgi:hypothetical protein